VREFLKGGTNRVDATFTLDAQHSAPHSVRWLLRQVTTSDAGTKEYWCFACFEACKLD